MAPETQRGDRQWHKTQRPIRNVTALQMGFGCAVSLLQWSLIKGRLNMLLACSEAKLYRTAVTRSLSAELPTQQQATMGDKWEKLSV